MQKTVRAESIIELEIILQHYEKEWREVNRPIDRSHYTFDDLVSQYFRPIYLHSKDDKEETKKRASACMKEVRDDTRSYKEIRGGFCAWL